MGLLSSGSIGTHQNYNSLIGSLVFLPRKQNYGIILKAIDIGLNLEICRFTIYFSTGEKFGTFVDEIRMVQKLSGSIWPMETYNNWKSLLKAAWDVLNANVLPSSFERESDQSFTNALDLIFNIFIFCYCAFGLCCFYFFITHAIIGI